MTSCFLEEQTAGKESPHNWQVGLGMALATFSDTYVELKTD